MLLQGVVGTARCVKSRVKYRTVVPGNSSNTKQLRHVDILSAQVHIVLLAALLSRLSRYRMCPTASRAANTTTTDLFFETMYKKTCCVTSRATAKTCTQPSACTRGFCKQCSCIACCAHGCGLVIDQNQAQTSSIQSLAAQNKHISKLMNDQQCQLHIACTMLLPASCGSHCSRWHPSCSSIKHTPPCGHRRLCSGTANIMIGMKGSSNTPGHVTWLD